MNGWQILISIFCGVGLIQGLAMAAYLWHRDKKYYLPTTFLSLALTGLAFRLAKSIFIFLPVEFPLVGLVPGALGLWTIGPSLYLFMTTTGNNTFRYRYLFHYVPAVVIMLIGLTGSRDLVISTYYWGVAHGFVYVALCFPFVRRERTPSRNIVKDFYLGVAGIMTMFAIQALISGIEIYSIGSIIAVAWMYVLSYRIAVNPVFFQSRQHKHTAEEEDICLRTERIIREQKIYRKKGLTLAELSLISGIPSYLISKAINKKYGTNFNEYINQFRIEEVKSLLESKPSLTVEAMADEVGFSSTSTFYASFKKLMGTTPHQYRQMLPTAK